MRCENCRVDIVEPVIHCPLCGAHLAGSSATGRLIFSRAAAPRRKRSWVGIVSKVMLVAIAIAVTLDIFLNPHEHAELGGYFSTGIAGLVILFATSLKWHNYMLQIVPLPVIAATSTASLRASLILCLLAVCALLIARSPTFFAEYKRRLHY